MATEATTDPPGAFRGLLEEASGWDRLGARPGLCRTCRHAQLLASAKSVFLRCGLADSDPRFARYPPLPVIACDGHAPADSGAVRS